MAYTTHFTMDLATGEVGWQVRNRGRFVCFCRTQRMADRIVRAMS